MGKVKNRKVDITGGPIVREYDIREAWKEYFVVSIL